MLWGAVEALEAAGPIGQWDLERESYASRIVADDSAFTAACEAGRALPLDRAVTYALS
jgi:hypothetical protein